MSIEDALKAAALIIKTHDLPEGIVEIVVIDRKHVLSKPVLLTKELSGTKANPIIIRSRGESVLSGGVNLFAWKQDHGAIAGFLPLHARRKVIVADLQENGVDAANLVLPDDSDPRLSPFPELYYGKWYVMNSVTTIDQTGDYKIGTRGLFESKDNKWGYPEGKGAVWFFAPPGFNPDLVILGVSPHAFIMKGAVHVSIENFKFEYFRGADIKTQ